eukprot:tig00000113_g5681.t1
MILGVKDTFSKQVYDPLTGQQVKRNTQLYTDSSKRVVHVCEICRILLWIGAIAGRACAISESVYYGENGVCGPPVITHMHTCVQMLAQVQAVYMHVYKDAPRETLRDFLRSLLSLPLQPPPRQMPRQMGLFPPPLLLPLPHLLPASPFALPRLSFALPPPLPSPLPRASFRSSPSPSCHPSCLHLPVPARPAVAVSPLSRRIRPARAAALRSVGMSIPVVDVEIENPTPATTDRNEWDEGEECIASDQKPGRQELKPMKISDAKKPVREYVRNVIDDLAMIPEDGKIPLTTSQVQTGIYLLMLVSSQWRNPLWHVESPCPFGLLDNTAYIHLLVDLARQGKHVLFCFNTNHRTPTGREVGHWILGYLRKEGRQTVCTFADSMNWTKTLGKVADMLHSHRVSVLGNIYDHAVQFNCVDCGVWIWAAVYTLMFPTCSDSQLNVQAALRSQLLTSKPDGSANECWIRQWRNGSAS